MLTKKSACHRADRLVSIQFPSITLMCEDDVLDLTRLSRRYYVYILHSAKSNRYYKGQTNDLVARLARHNGGHERATHPGRPWTLVWFDVKETREAAMELEKKLKNLSRVRLKEFVSRHPVEVVGDDDADKEVSMSSC